MLGRAVVKRFLQADESVKLKLLVRAPSDEALRSRIDRLLKYLGLADKQDRVEGVRGDITLPNMGIPNGKYRGLARDVSGLIHCAACTRWDLPLEILRATNTEGTKRVADLAHSAVREGALDYFAHISTAYVAGDRSGVIRESELWEGQKFNNNYERSKFEAEMFLRSIADDVPTIVFRPSMIVGDSRTGETPNFNVFYYVVKLMVKGRLDFLPTTKSSLVDMAPSDYAAKAIHEIINQGFGVGKTFHLCSGPGATPSMKEIFELITDFFSRCSAAREENRFRCPMMLNPTLYKYGVSPFLKATLPANKRKRLKNVELYIPYTSARKIFDITNTMAVIGNGESVPPRLRDYYRNIFQYCLDVDWKAEEPAF